MPSLVERIQRKDIRRDTDAAKAQVYAAIDGQYHQGYLVRVAEHRSGFPAVTVDCGDLHYTTDCLSLEEWWRQHQQAHTLAATSPTESR